MDVAEIIRLFELKPHPEGGFFKETYRSDEKFPAHALPSRYHSDRYLYTAIYYLLTEESFSVMHRIQTDELLHFYLGDPVYILQLHPDGHAETKIMGNNIASGHSPQCLIPRGIWQGARLVEGGRFALMGTTTTPGFDFEDFEIGESQKLKQLYPDQRHVIERFTT